MPIPRYIPDDWPTMKSAIFAWARGVVDRIDPSIRVYWAEQNAPSPTLPRVSLNQLTPPFGGRFTDKRVEGVLLTVEAETGATVVFPNAGPGGVGFFFPAAASIEALRDQIVTTLEASADVPDPVPYGLSHVRWPAPVPDELRGVEPGTNLSAWMVQAQYAERIVTWSVDVYADPKIQDVAPLHSALRASLEGELVREALEVAGWTFRTVEGDRQPDQIAGSVWQGRAGFDVRMACKERLVELLSWIETVEVVGPDEATSTVIGD